ncbi:MAG: DUF983 domain-containing protein [Planctomycetota bacterium]
MARTPLDVSYKRALKLRCPRCGEGRLFAGWFTMNERCEHCSLQYEREPGYFLGSSYINYGWTAMSMTVAYMLLHFVLEYPNEYVLPPLVAYIVIFPLVFFRYARALWLALDIYFDHSALTDLPTEGPSAAASRNDSSE